MQEFWFSICQDAKVKVTFHVAKCGNPYSELVLCIYPIQSAHTDTAVNTHPEQWAAILQSLPDLRLKLILNEHLCFKERCFLT